MTGITDVVRNCRRAYWHGRLALLLLVMQLPRFMQGYARALFPVGLDTFDSPVGKMPQAKLEYFQELRMGVGRTSLHGAAPIRVRGLQLPSRHAVPAPRKGVLPGGLSKKMVI